MNYKQSHPNYDELEITWYSRGRLRLIEPKIEYAKIALNWIRDEETGQYMGADFSDPTLEKEQERLGKIIENTDEYSWMIELDEKVIGNVSINDIREKSEEYATKAGNLTILIGEKNHWGQGIGQNVAQSALDWAFKKAGFKIMLARALEPNTGSIKTLTKLGFKKIGTSPYERLIKGQPVLWFNFELTRAKTVNRY